MKITFVQEDIISAIKTYIVSQGISLEHKAITVDFTMKRKGGGVSADVNIESAFVLPMIDEENEQPQLTVVPTKHVLVAVATPVAETVEETQNELIVVNTPNSFIEELPEEFIPEEITPVTAPAVKTTSLFN